MEIMNRVSTRHSLTIIFFVMLCFVKMLSFLFQMNRLTESMSGDLARHKDELLDQPTTSHGNGKAHQSIIEQNQTIIDKALAFQAKLHHREESVHRGISVPASQAKDGKQSFLIWNSLNINRQEPCDVSCNYTTDSSRRKHADASVYERRGYRDPYAGDKFSIYMQMEGTHYYPIKLDKYHLENSYRWSSPVLKPYFEWIHYSKGELNISNPPVDFNSTIDGATFIARNCDSQNERESIVKQLRKASIRVDGLSSCLETPGTLRDPRKNKRQMMRNNKRQMMMPYKFNLAFENGNVEDYVTEKVYEALSAGVIPVYMGAPNIREFVPDGSIIDLADFDGNATRLAQHLQACMQNETRYNSYHAWRSRPLPDWFVRKFNFTWISTECRTCRYMHALHNGWEWDKENQRGIQPSS